MIVRLNDSPRVRELTRACRRTGLVRSHPSWLWRSRRAGDSTDTHPVAWVIFRLGLTILIACGGKFVAEQPLAAQLLTLVGIVFMQARINYLRNQLEDDPSLAVLAQFPVPDWLVFTYQTRQRWRTACWHALDASAFWMVAWTAQYGSIPWMWLPIVAATHAMVIEAMAWALVRVWPMFGLTLFAGGGAIVWIIAQKQQLPSWLWSAAEPLLQALAWLTPWGWLNSTARQLPEQTYLGFVIFALGVFAVCGIVWAFDHVRRIWVLNPIWREFAGRPMQTWDEWDDDHIDEKKPTEPSALTADHHREKSGLVHLGQETSANSSHVVRSLAALSRARNTPSGQHLLTLGWAGRHALARCDSDDRWLVDLLAPQGTDTTWWRWALLCAALPAATAIAGQSPLWATGLLTLILLFHRMKWQAIAIGTVTIGALVWPHYAPAGILLPCVIAVLMSVPVVGGGWNGLPMTITLLGTMPRRWSRMMRIMLIFTGLRLISGIPIMALVIIALYFGIHPTLAVVIGACWITIVLSAPWLLALRLIQRTPGGVDLRLGRRLLTAGSASCVMAHMIAIGLLISGCCMMVNADGNGQSDIIMPIIGIGLSIVTSLFHLALLRHSYRRRVDLILSV